MTKGFSIQEIADNLVQWPELAREMEAASDSFSKEDRSFSCRNCHTLFTPAPGQFIFYELCDTCFIAFERQKMRGRFSVALEGKEIPYTESCDEWIATPGFQEEGAHGED